MDEEIWVPCATLDEVEAFALRMRSMGAEVVKVDGVEVHFGPAVPEDRVERVAPMDPEDLERANQAVMYSHAEG